MMYKGFKTRIYPNKEQENLLWDYCYYSHKMWNWLVGKFNNTSPTVGKYEIKGYGATEFANDFINSYPNSNIIPSRIFKTVMIKYCQSWKNCYSNIGKCPKFHKYNPNKQSFSIGSQTLKLDKDKVRVPKSRSYKDKIDMYIPVSGVFLSKFNISEVINPTFSYIRGKWYLSGSYKIITNTKFTSTNLLGLDWGIKNFYTISDNVINNRSNIDYPDTVKRTYQRIKKLTSIKDKKVKNSNNYFKVLAKLEKSWERFNNIKTDFIEQTTCKLSKFNIAIEDLTNASILKSHKGRRRLQLLQPRHRFNTRLEQKCIENGNRFILINPANTSRACCKCGQLLNITLKDREINCNCGNVMDRDLNAALNIKFLGIKELQKGTVNP